MLLELTGIHKRYGGVHALRGVDFAVDAGQVHALVGENGAGKSTLIKIASGAEAADSGTVRVDGRELGHGSTSAALDAGIATVYQEPQLFAELTVAENIFLGREHRRFGRVDWRAQRAQVSDLLDRLGLDQRMADVRVADLPAAEQQLVSIAKAFAHDARVLILDEPSAVLTDREIGTLFTVVRGLRESGAGVVYISHRLDELRRISDQVTVLRDGRVVAVRQSAELSVREVAELMVGEAIAERTVDRRPPSGDPVLEVAGLGRGHRFHDVTFDVRAGEIVALYGLVGSGAGDVARALFGIDPAERGTVRVNGRDALAHDPVQALRSGISMLPGNRKQQGVFASKSVAFNIASAHLRWLAKAGFWVDRKRERGVAREFIDRIAIKTPSSGTQVGALSGGNQQKVVLARQLVERPEVLVLEEPTQGVAVGAKDEIHQLVVELAEAGSAVVVVSSDLPEALFLADRLLVVRDGRVVREFARGARQADVLAAAAGDDEATEEVAS
ncbi:MAG TPA: sugar ABC transporter ATP-binding protein [Streptosporangiales bacterium]